MMRQTSIRCRNFLTVLSTWAAERCFPKSLENLSWRGSWLLTVVLACGLTGRTGMAQNAPVSQAAVDAALARAYVMLAQEQSPSGAWRSDGWGEDTAITSLAVMAFMAGGHVPGEGPYGEHINRGIRWVLTQQDDNGMLVNRNRSHGPMYSHGITTLMLAEVAGMVGNEDAPAVRRALEKGILLILRAQAVSKNERHAGGWRYQSDSRDSDLSVTGWQVLALRAAKDIGCDVPAESIDLAISYVKNCAMKGGRGGNQDLGFGYQPGTGSTPTLTGTGITCLEVCGEHHSPEAVSGANWLRNNPLNLDTSYFFYGAYYTGVGMYKMGGDHAREHAARLQGILIPTQQADGSWNPGHGSERNAGRVYATSLAVLALAIEYGYLPIYQR